MEIGQKVCNNNPNTIDICDQNIRGLFRKNQIPEFTKLSLLFGVIGIGFLFILIRRK